MQSNYYCPTRNATLWLEIHGFPANRIHEGGDRSITGTLDMAMIGNCQVAALIDSTAEFVCSCLPRFDGDHSLLNAAIRLSKRWNSAL